MKVTRVHESASPHTQNFVGRQRLTMFSKLSKGTLVRAAPTHNAPVHVQFYVTARCNLTCQQCNIIFANSDVRECTLDKI
jgi:hypothetical protein